MKAEELKHEDFEGKNLDDSKWNINKIPYPDTVEEYLGGRYICSHLETELIAFCKHLESQLKELIKKNNRKREIIIDLKDDIENIEKNLESQLKERDKEIAHLRGEVKILKPLAEELMSDKTQNKEDE